MKIYRKAQQQFYFATTCVNQPSGEDIEKMTDNAQDISWEEFNKHVSNDEIRKAIGSLYNFQYDYDDQKNGAGLRFQDDYAVSFHRSKFKGIPCYYFVHSAIEYVFLPSTQGGL